MNSDACVLVCTALKWAIYISHSRAARRDKLRGCQQKLGNKLNKLLTANAGDAFVVKCMCMNMWTDGFDKDIMTFTSLQSVLAQGSCKTLLLCYSIYLNDFWSAKGEKVQVWIWDSFQNFFQAVIVCKRCLLAGNHWYFCAFRINSRDLWDISTWYLSAVITRNTKVGKYIKLSVECFYSVSCLEQQRNKRKPQSQQVVMHVWMGKKRPDEFMKTWIWLDFSAVLPLIYFYNARIRLTMPQLLLALLIAHSLSLESLHLHILDFSRPSKTLHIPLLVSLFFHLRLQPQLYLRYFGVDRRPFETEYPFTSHTFLINENDFSPHTHPTRPSHPLIYRRHGGLSWQRPSCDVFSPMCMALLSVKLCFIINKTGLSLPKYRKWVGETVNCD